MGLYSMLRFHVGLFPAQARAFAPLMIALAVIGILYGASLALVQSNFFKLLAFGALSHLSLVILAIYGLTLMGWSGAVFQIVSLGIVEGAMFVLLGALDSRYGTAEIAAYGGLATNLPRTATFFVLSGLTMVGLPLLGNFVGEFIILSTTFTQVSRSAAVLAAISVILSAVYVLWLVQRLFYGGQSKLTTQPESDLRLPELVALVPLVILMFVMGTVPSFWLNSIQTGVHPPLSGLRLHIYQVVIPASAVQGTPSPEDQR
jgi:NADH-quinone oxidoreductase subunit M